MSSTKRGTNHVQSGTTGRKPDVTPDDFPSEFDGEFQSLSPILCANLGTIAGLALAGGGYFGLSVTDDGGSVRIAVRHAALQFDKRFYNLAKFEGATAWLAARLRERETS